MMSERSYCSELAADEPMWGTADEVDVWLLLEYMPRWNAKAVTDNALSEASKAWLDRSMAAATARGLKVRPQFIRQPEVDRDEVCLMLAFDDRLWTHRGVGYDFLQDVDVAETLDMLPEANLTTQSHYFVCTNGQRDVCCARFGLPAYARLRELVSTRVWQTTHLGGHRFAPNVLTLPQGVLYGRVLEEHVGAFVAEVDDGGVSFAHMRGRSRFPKLVQAAEVMAAQPNLKLLHVDGDERSAAVTFASANDTVKVAVETSRDPVDVLASCSDEATKPVCPFQAS